jgi:nitrite reductase/ring-hydroxylating ferredoxin subunit
MYFSQSTGPKQQPPTSVLCHDSRSVWRTVTRSADLAEGTVLPFELGSVRGFLSRASGKAQAFSAACTHQGCLLNLTIAGDRLCCACHGAAFTLTGANLTRTRDIARQLPVLPQLAVRERDGQVQVLASDPISAG